jgi:hypothetical protein
MDDLIDPVEVTVHVMKTHPDRVFVRAVKEPGEFIVARNDDVFGPFVAGDRTETLEQDGRTIIAAWPIHRVSVDRADFNGFLNAKPSR